MELKKVIQTDSNYCEYVLDENWLIRVFFDDINSGFIVSFGEYYGELLLPLTYIKSQYVFNEAYKDSQSVLDAVANFVVRNWFNTETKQKKLQKLLDKYSSEILHDDNGWLGVKVYLPAKLNFRDFRPFD